MDKTIQQLAKIGEERRTTLELFQVYYDKLEFCGFSGYEPFLANEVITNLKYLKAFTSPTTIPQANFTELFAEYARMTDSYERMKKVFIIFSTNKVDLSRQGSHSSSGTSVTTMYITDINKILDGLISSYKIFETNVGSGELLGAIVEDVDPDLVGSTKLPTEINDIYRKYVDDNRGGLVIDLYTTLLERIVLVNVDAPAAKEINRIVNAFVEGLKTDVIRAPKSTMPTIMPNTVQQLIQMYNLVPDGVSRTLSDMFDGESDLAKIGNMLMKTKKTGLIVITKVMKVALEYNLWTLTSQEYIDKHDLAQPPEVGVNLKNLERSRTIRMMSSNLQKAKGTNASDSVMFYPSATGPTPDFYQIVETIDGATYHFLMPWGGTITSIPSTWYLPLRDPKALAYPSPRQTGYNLILQTEIMKYLQKPLLGIEVLERSEINREEAYWRGLRDRIRRQIVEYVQEIFIETFIEPGPSAPRITASSIDSVIFNDAIYQKMLDDVTSNIILDNVADVSARVPADVLKYVHAELMMSYYFEISYIQKVFKKDVENAYKKDHEHGFLMLVKNSSASGTPLVIKNKLIEILNTVLSEVLERIINRKSGIYLAIQKKFDVLTKSLLLPYF